MRGPIEAPQAACAVDPHLTALIDLPRQSRFFAPCDCQVCECSAVGVVFAQPGLGSDPELAIARDQDRMQLLAWHRPLRMALDHAAVRIEQVDAAVDVDAPDAPV